MADKYADFEALSRGEKEGSDFRIRLKAEGKKNAVVIAPHGGSIEPGTSELAFSIAGSEIFAGAFEGVKKAGNGGLHITSTNFDEPSILKMVSEADHVLAIHGESSDCDAVFLGGRDSELARHVEFHLKSAGFEVKRHVNPSLQGTSPANICNKGRRGAGVQLELARGLRESLFQNLKRNGRENPTAKFTLFVNAIRDGLALGGAL